jgi:hypothetical protein
MMPPRPFLKLVRVADAVLIGGATGSLLVLWHFVYRYYWTTSREFSSGVDHFVSVGGPLLLAVALLVTLTRTAAARVKVAMCLCSAGVSIFAVELFLTMWRFLPIGQESETLRKLEVAAHAQGLEFDGRSKLEVVDHLRSTGLEAVPSMFPVALLKRQDGATTSVIRVDGTEMLPLASVSNTRTVVCNEGAGYLTYTSDERGFHNPSGLWDKRPMDIVAIGDSFVHGWCVPSSANFVAGIRRRYPATLSLGIEGNGPLEMLATLREYGPILAPKTVLWFFFDGNDLIDLGLRRESALLRSYLEAGFTQRLFERQDEIDRALLSHLKEAGRNHLGTTLQDAQAVVADPTWVRKNLSDISKLSLLRSRLGLVGREADDRRAVATVSSYRSDEMSDVFHLLTTILVEAKHEVEKWGGRLVFVYLPARNRYDPDDFHPDPNRAEVLARARSVDLSIIDIDEAFRRTGDPMGLFPLRAADHYNEAGHALVASTVVEHLSK